MSEKLSKMKTYQKMPDGKSVARKNLPKAISKNLDGFLKAGLIKQTRRGYYMKTETETKEEVVEEPAWVDAASAVEGVELNEGETSGDAPASPLTAFTLTLGNRAAAIVQMCDALANGQATLAVLQDIKGQAVMMLADLNLLQPAPEAGSDEEL